MSERSRRTLNRNVSRIFRSKFDRTDKSLADSNLGSVGQSYTLKNFENGNFDQNILKYKTNGLLTSTQELNIDFSKFENHTFFDSAVAKTNVSLNNIINNYPFDGSLEEVERFESNMSGFEKYIFDSIPKNKGYLILSGTQTGENGSNGQFITVSDIAGVVFPSFSKNKTAKAILDPTTSSFSFETYLNLPTIANDNQVIIQKKTSLSSHMSLVLSESSSTETCNVMFGLTQGTKYLMASASLEKGSFKHVAVTYERQSQTLKSLSLFIDGELVNTSSKDVDIDSITFNNSALIIGSGSEVRINDSVFTPQQTFSGSIDELRYFHSARSQSQIKEKIFKNVYPDNKNMLILNFRFNESGDATEIPDAVLDSSGNSLHSQITNYTSAIRNTGSYGAPPLKLERFDRNPVLYTSHPTIETLTTDLLTSGSEYDDLNPNLITKLVPVHYFLEGNNLEGFSEVFGNLTSGFSSNTIPGSSQIQSAQLLVTFLLVWAKFFDELKLYIDNFSLINFVDYNDKETVPDIFLKNLAHRLGIELPDLFAYGNIAQFYDGDDILNNSEKAKQNLKQIRDQVWRRILSVTTSLQKKKGTLQSVKSMLRASGINPDDFLEIREYGGPTKRTLANARESQQKVIRLIDFSGSIGNTDQATDSLGYYSQTPHIISSYLSSSRVEKGLPTPVGSFVASEGLFHGQSDNRSDGLLTSGSFTYEGVYQFKNNVKHFATQSLMRLFVTGTSSPSSHQGLIGNLLLISSSNSSTPTELKFVTRVSTGSSSENVHTVSLYSASFFDGSPWYISVQRIPGGFSGNQSIRSSSFTLRAAKQSFGKIVEQYFTSSFFQEDKAGTSGNIILQNASDEFNTSGSFIVIGSQSIQETSSNYFLNDSTISPSDARETNFSGRLARIRFWSKPLSSTEWKEHVRNFTSKGVDDAYVNYNFNKTSSGSFERLRLDATLHQNTTGSDSSGEIRIFDFSQNNFHFTGKGFESSKKVIKGDYYSLSKLSSRFDSNVSSQKVRVRGLLNEDRIDENPYAKVGYAYEFPVTEEVTDDTRFSIDYSIVKGMNDDIISTFSSLDFFDDALGRPNLMFSNYYHDLDKQREVYFNNLTQKMDFKKYYNLFKWFDNTFSDIILSMLPRKTSFMGINFVVESHVLERHKMRYYYDEIYLKSVERNPDRGNLLLSQFVGKLKKY